MAFELSSSIKLRLSKPPSEALSYQVLSIELASADRLIEPQDLATLTLPPGIDATGGVVITGRAPIWLYAYLVHELHPTAWVACYDPRLGGGVVVATHSRLARIGQVIPLPQLQISPRLKPALLVVGPPDSGKSVLSHALFTALLPQQPEVFLQRANWDGEGNWILELPASATPEQRETLKLDNKGSLSDRFFVHQAQSVLHLRQQKPLVIVDVGGRVQPEKMPVLEACSHYLIISAQPDEVGSWHEFCRDRGNLRPFAVIHSTLDETLQIHRQEPYLELTCGPWVQGQTQGVPEILLEAVQRLLLGSKTYSK